MTASHIMQQKTTMTNKPSRYLGHWKSLMFRFTNYILGVKIHLLRIYNHIPMLPTLASRQLKPEALRESDERSLIGCSEPTSCKLPAAAAHATRIKQDKASENSFTPIV